MNFVCVHLSGSMRLDGSLQQMNRLIRVTLSGHFSIQCEFGAFSVLGLISGASIKHGDKLDDVIAT